jgi:hypothetical protein
MEACGERRLGLFAVACCRRLWPHLGRDWTRRFVETAEEYFDGQASDDALSEALQEVLWRSYASLTGEAPEEERELSWKEEKAADSAERLLIQATGSSLAYYGDIRSGEECYDEFVSGLQGLQIAAAGRRSAPGMKKVARQQAHLLRDVFGNPFHDVALDPAWVTGRQRLVRRLAQAAYEHRRLPEGTLESERLAVLADALEEAGCDDQDILGHLRGAGPHVRGCWVIDALLAR